MYARSNYDRYLPEMRGAPDEYRAEFTEVPGGQHSPESWRRRLPIGLVALQAP